MPVRDEDPSEEDIERFSAETAYCPDCGAEIWDQAEICPKCFAYLDKGPSPRKPLQAWIDRRWFILVIMMILIAFILLALYGVPSRSIP